jgi:hypothetical protein
LIIVRTKLEDSTLQPELPGYTEYSALVRYRLFPEFGDPNGPGLNAPVTVLLRAFFIIKSE